MTGSNRRPIACKAIALPAELIPLNLVPILTIVDYDVNRTCRVLTVSRPTPTRITLRLAQTTGGQG